MYDEVYEGMVDCDVASKLDHLVLWIEMVALSLKNDAYGIKVTHYFDHSDYCLVVDEVGSNLSKKGDGHIIGKKYVCERGCVPQIKVKH